MTERLVHNDTAFLRHPRADDEDELLSLRELSESLHRPWEPIPDVGWASHEWFVRFIAQGDTADSQKHLICRAGDGAIVGYVGLGQICRGPFCSCYMGYWVGLPHVRRGYATAGVSLCLERAFTQLGLHRVEANVIPDNAASIAVVRRCGLTREGYSKRYLNIAGRWRDHERWAITVEDWNEAHVAQGR